MMGNVILIRLLALLPYIFKLLGIIFILFLGYCVCNLFKIFERMPDILGDKCWVAWGIFSEVIVILIIATRIVVM